MKQVLTKSILAFFIVILVFAIFSKSSSHNDVLKAGKIIDTPFEAVNHLGEKFTNKSWEGKYKLIFFGFASCPVICPSELSRISSIIDKLPPEISGNISPVFITIDPERDTAENIKDYVEMFHKDMIGITGNREQIDKIIDIYSVHAKKIEIPEMDTYMYDHSTFIYFISDDNKLLALYKMEEKVEDIVKDVKKKYIAK